ncbi:TonB-dependent receptor [Pseudoalteromonas sp. Of11M-6]|uniref:TonB-dependent receptor domain-containing protein n=1 Tax=Pseudoalteromonas sp. Of11M-6 TaxID=2917754 RepID=UPI001EF62DF1|nr:TonB-dependent receptor [Pseudoalteromonas sp. Of11M-6]MCG7555840.1 TonB-dependent receptor [Pseudoalteromonas sp. Of11M-6]
MIRFIVPFVSSVIIFPGYAANADSKSIEVIEIVANKAEKSLLELSGSAAVLSDDDIEQLVATQLSDLFKTEPGVAITGYSGRPQNITIRGMSGNRVLVLQNGSRAADGYGASDINDLVGRFNFDLEDVKSIEVAKGPASTFFGAGALAGVVKVNTKQASDYLGSEDNYLAIKSLYNGTNSEVKNTLTGATGFLGLPVLLKVSDWRAEEQQNFPESRAPLDVKGQSAKFSSQYESGLGLFTYDFSWLTQQTENKIKPETVPQHDGAWQVESQKQRELQQTHSHSVKWQSVNSSLIFDDALGQMFWRKTQHENDTEQLISRQFFEVQTRYRQLLSEDRFSQTSFGGVLDFAKSFGNHELMYGISAEQVEHERPKVDTVIENGTRKVTIDAPFNAAKTVILGAYVGDDWQINSNFRALIGLRYDHNALSAEGDEDTSSNEVTASAQIRYENSYGFNAYGAYAQGYRAAPYDKVYGNIPHLFAFPPFEIVANTQLRAETSDSLELGFSQTIDKLHFASSIYYTRYDDFIDWVNIRLRLNDGVMERQFVNIDEAYTFGAEAEVTYQLESLMFGANIGWMNGKNKDKQEYLRNLIPLEYTFYANYEFSDFVINLQWYGQSQMTDLPTCQDPFLNVEIPCQSTGSWHSLDLSVSYTLSKNWKFNTAINNVLDKQYTRYQDVAGQSNSDFDYSQPGRNFRASIQYKF